MIPLVFYFPLRYIELMNEEFEVKFLNISPKEIEAKLIELGAKKAFDSLFMIVIFDYPDLRLHEKGAWVRVRDEEIKCVMTFKQRLGIDGNDGKKNDSGMEEYEIEVSDFETACKILKKIGLTEKFIEEKKRTRYFLDNVEIDIDTCPGLDPYLEIEGKSWDSVETTIKKLGLDPKDKKIFSTYQIYKLAGIDMLKYKEFSFKNGLVRR